MHLKGGFSRSGGLQAGINAVEVSARDSLLVLLAQGVGYGDKSFHDANLKPCAHTLY